MTPTLDDVDRALLNKLQTDFPLASRPYEVIARQLEIPAAEVLRRIRRLKRRRVLRQIGAIFDSAALGYSSSLVAMKLSPERLDEAARVVNRHPGVRHNYTRDHDYNLWFTITTPPGQPIENEVESLRQRVGADAARSLPTLRLFKIGVAFDMTDAAPGQQRLPASGRAQAPAAQRLSREEITAVRALQEDLPVEERPFKTAAERFGLSEDRLIDTARGLLERGAMRRFAATLRHREAGFVANAMGVWVVQEDRVDEVGRTMAGFAAVSHCYQRPTFPDWPYSLFTMIHGHSKEDCEAVARSISETAHVPDYRLLYSVREYKKTRVRYFDPDEGGVADGQDPVAGME